MNQLTSLTLFLRTGRKLKLPLEKNYDTLDKPKENSTSLPVSSTIQPQKPSPEPDENQN